MLSQNKLQKIQLIFKSCSQLIDRNVFQIVTLQNMVMIYDFLKNAITLKAYNTVIYIAKYKMRCFAP